MNEEAYTASMQIYYELGLFFKAVTEEYGLEKVMQLHEKSYAMYGEGMESMLSEQYPDGVDLKSFGEMMTQSLISTGFESEMIMEDDETLIIRNTKCPRYEGMKMAGHGDEIIKQHCLRGVKVLEKHLQNVDPDFKFDVPIWDAPNGRCDEVFTLKK